LVIPLAFEVTMASLGVQGFNLGVEFRTAHCE
jgi:hypothetical protein